MKVLIGLIILGVVGVLAISFFLPRKIQITTTENIRTSLPKLQAQVLDFKAWKNWNGIYKLDPKAKIAYHTDTLGVGSAIELISQEKGNMLISFAKFDSLKGVECRYYMGYQLDSTKSTITSYINKKHTYQALAKINYKQDGDLIQVVHYYEIDLGWFPVNKLFGYLFLENPLIEQFREEMQSLKKYLETTPTT